MRHLSFGHIIIQKDGLDCACGLKGCFEKYGSMKALKENVRHKLGLNSITGEELYQIIKTGNAESVVDEFLDNLSVGFINLINIFEPEAICIGGSFVYFEDLLLTRLTKKIVGYNNFYSKVPKIIVAKMGNDAGMIGATIS